MTDNDTNDRQNEQQEASQPDNSTQGQENQQFMAQISGMQAITPSSVPNGTVQGEKCAEFSTQEPSSIQARSRHLRPQRAGEPSHNPNGRPKGSKDSLRASWRRILREKPTATLIECCEALKVPVAHLEKVVVAEGLGSMIMAQAIGGDVQAARLIATHCERPLKTDQPDVQVNVSVLPDRQRALEILARRGPVLLPEERRRRLLAGEPGESLALPIAQPAIERKVDPLDELASFAV